MVDKLLGHVRFLTPSTIITYHNTHFEHDQVTQNSARVTVFGLNENGRQFAANKTCASESKETVK